MQKIQADPLEILIWLFFSVLVIVIILTTRFFIQRAMQVPGKLFQEALQKENDGHFEEAEMGYRSALVEVKCRRFQSNRLKNAIVEKLKVLNTVIEYRKMCKATS
jgi:hypothetical protein